ncbi:MAG TPA: hypothetical protein PKD28_01005 [Candidatus Saccharibacteria bacterium]|nr:hypothetical protein [Candidatus Saccharibacteria bacterium]
MNTVNIGKRSITKIIIALSIVLLSAGVVFGALLILESTGVIKSGENPNDQSAVSKEDPARRAASLEEQASEASANNDYTKATNLYEQAADLYLESKDTDAAANAAANAESVRQSAKKSPEVPEEDVKSSLPKS